VKAPKECESIDEIRQAIDSLDYDIMKLFGKRFQYVKEIVKFKTDEESIIAAPRRDSVLMQRRIWAEENGLDPDVFEDLYRTLIMHFISEEMDILKQNNK